MPSRGKESYSIQAVEHALDMLEAFCEEEEIRLSRLSERLGISKASIFRLLMTFENLGYVEKAPGTGKYRLGLSAYEMGQKFLSRMTLLRHARPVMERLARHCNEAVYLVVRRDREALFLYQVDNTHQVKIVSLVGRRFPLEETAAGRLFLAYAGGGEAGGKAFPPNALRAEEQAAIQREGVCVDLNGTGEGIACAAVPLFKQGGVVAGALALLAPDFRLQQERLVGEVLPQLKEAGEVISSRLGCLGNYAARGRL